MGLRSVNEGIRGTPLITRIIVYWGLHWFLPLNGHCHVELAGAGMSLRMGSRSGAFEVMVCRAA